MIAAPGDLRRGGIRGDGLEYVSRGHVEAVRWIMDEHCGSGCDQTRGSWNITGQERIWVFVASGLESGADGTDGISTDFWAG